MKKTQGKRKEKTHMEEGGPCALTLRLSHVFLAYVSLKNVKTPLLQTTGSFPSD